MAESRGADMVEPALIFTTSFFVAFSGALMPGPLTAVTVEHVFRRGYPAAPLVTLGHGLLEAAVVALLLLGLGDHLARPSVTGIIGLAGGLVLAWMSYGMIRGALAGKLSLEGSGGKGRAGRSPFWGGVIATATNPYWFLWWGTIGAGYVALSRHHGYPGVALFFGGHILADFLWFSLLALVLASGKRWLNNEIYRWIIFGLGLFLGLFSLYFFWWGLNIFLGKG